MKTSRLLQGRQLTQTVSAGLAGFARIITISAGNMTVAAAEAISALEKTAHIGIEAINAHHNTRLVELEVRPSLFPGNVDAPRILSAGTMDPDGL